MPDPSQPPEPVHSSPYLTALREVAAGYEQLHHDISGGGLSYHNPADTAAFLAAAVAVWGKIEDRSMRELTGELPISARMPYPGTPERAAFDATMKEFAADLRSGKVKTEPVRAESGGTLSEAWARTKTRVPPPADESPADRASRLMRQAALDNLPLGYNLNLSKAPERYGIVSLRRGIESIDMSADQFARWKAAGHPDPAAFVAAENNEILRRVLPGVPETPAPAFRVGDRVRVCSERPTDAGPWIDEWLGMCGEVQELARSGAVIVTVRDAVSPLSGLRLKAQPHWLTKVEPADKLPFGGDLLPPNELTRHGARLPFTEDAAPKLVTLTNPETP